jgi:hypothetical protein
MSAYTHAAMKRVSAEDVIFAPRDARGGEEPGKGRRFISRAAAKTAATDATSSV